MKRHWLVSRTNPEFLSYISKELSISRLLAQVLVNRGFREVDSIKSFLSPSSDDMHDPFLLPDMDKAVTRLKKAIEKRERVLVHGDYDADGLTSTAVLVLVLENLGIETFYHIPNRLAEGYGFSQIGIQKAIDSGVSLIITADCGVSAHDGVLHATSKGLDVIITDHHKPSETLPDATAVIDPHRNDSSYPFKYLAGVGVAFKLCQALLQELNVNEMEAIKYVDLVALGTIADSVPLVDENRVFVTFGLREINSGNCRTGIKSLKDITGMSSEFKANSMSYTMIPRINAAGRLDDAGEVVELFITNDENRATEIASLLDAHNKNRQKIESEVLQSALRMIDRNDLDNSIILASPEWHPGVVGIVASKLVEKFHRPVFLFSQNEQIAKGSARGIPGLNLYDAVSECSELLLAFGGHRMAAGLKIMNDNLPDFKIQINTFIGKNLSTKDMAPMLEIDASVNLSEINFGLVRELCMLEPYGESNRAPVFGAKDITIVNQRIVGNNHLKLLLRQGSINVDTIGFSMGDQLDDIDSDASVDIAFIPAINEWQGMKNVQLNLKGIRPSF